MSEIELYEQIENYLHNRLSPEARQRFESDMLADPGLAEQVALHRDMLDAIPSQDVIDLRRLMTESYKAEFGDNTKKDENSRPFTTGRQVRIIVVAITLLILLAAGIWWMQCKPAVEVVKDPPSVIIDTLSEPVSQDTLPVPPKQNVSPVPAAKNYASIVQKIYRESPYASGNLMGTGNDPDETTLQKASEAYAKNQFKETFDLLQTLPREGHTEALKLRAHSLFRLGRYTRAAADFMELSKSFSYGSDAEWHLLLCHAALLPKTQKEYDTLLKKVGAAGHPFEKKAHELNRKISTE